MQKLKGTQVLLSIEGAPVGKSTSCSVSLSSQTTEAASKDDADGMFDNPEITQVTWEVKNESFVVDHTKLCTLLQQWIDGKPLGVSVKSESAGLTLSGKAFIASVSVEASVSDYAKVSLSLTGQGRLDCKH